MYDARTVRNSLRYLYRGAIYEHGYAKETVSALLRELDYRSLSAVFHRNARHVHAFETRGKTLLSFHYNGQDLFKQRAVALYSYTAAYDVGASIHSPEASVSYEIWMKEDGNLVTVSRLALHCGDELDVVYREVKGWPWAYDLNLTLDLQALTDELKALSRSARKAQKRAQGTPN